ncbi:MAG: hypothetical protein VKM34_11905 [Cyanobacteriota bacterium]|nr:hypothetical protein [Cyanobacteriota bacterium]
MAPRTGAQTSLRTVAKATICAGALAVLGFAAPARAVSEPSFTVNGFTGLFAEPNWTFNDGTANTGTGSITSTTLTMTSPTGATSSDSVEYLFNTNTLLSAYPDLVDGRVSFTYNYSTADVLAGYDPFFFIVGANATQITPLVGTSFNGSLSFNITQGQTFGFRLTNDGPGGENALPATLSVTNFSYTGGPIAIPGPLPVLAAAAALGWSGALRRRIRHANQSAAPSLDREPSAV